MIKDFKKAQNERDGIKTPEELFEDAKGKLSEVLMLGITPDKDLYFVATMQDKAKMLFLIEQFKFELLAGVYDEGYDDDEY